ncbi:MAG: hypothetical protein ABSH44_17890 [Bryobacteraceae bacterium]|jgi:hypothetical protein
MTFKRCVVILAILALAAQPALAKPNFSGEWKLNVSKSSFGQMPAPASMTNKIAHEDPKLTSHVKQSGERGDFEFDATYTTDGKECTNELFGNPVTSTLKWDGDTLLIDTKGTFGGNELTMQDKWTLSDDGKRLTIIRLFKSSMGEGEQKLILEK